MSLQDEVVHAPYPALPVPCIRVHEYYSGGQGFIPKPGLKFQVSLRGYDLQTYDLCMQSDGLTSVRADEVAKEWSDRLRWPIVYTKEKRKVEVETLIVSIRQAKNPL